MQKDVDTLKMTRVLYDDDARGQLYKGLSIAAAAVGCTLGPRGKTVLIQQDECAPIVTKDGVTVCKSVKLRDPVQRMGAELIKEAASQTNEIAGDGTTTATVLTLAMVTEGLKLLRTGYPAKELCFGIEMALEHVDDHLQAMAKKLTTFEEIAQVGTISANGDKMIGELIARAMQTVGQDGIITVEDAKGMATTLDVAEGMQVDRGYASPYFVNNPDKMVAAYTDVRVLITDKKLSVLKDLIPVLEKVVQARQPLLIIADDIEGEALQGLVVNRVNGQLPVVAIKAPGYGQHKVDLLHDMAIMVGTKLISASTGLKLEDVSLSDLGTLKKVVADSKTTTMVGTGATKKEIEDRLNSLRAQLQDITLSADDTTKLRMRIAKLANGVAIIKVGGATEIEMIERKYRIEDALNATKAAAAEGIVPGGGMALAGTFIDSIDKKFSTIDAEQQGANIVMKACTAPMERILLNAGSSFEVIMHELQSKRRGGDETVGYDAANQQFDDLMAIGVIDPVKVTRTALKNAASVAMTFLTLDAVVVEDDNNE